MEKIKLPIDENKDDNIRPSNPDFWWLWKMLIITIPLIIISYIFFYLFSYFIIWNISIEKEKELFSDIVINEKNIRKININEFLINKIDDYENIDIYIEESKIINAYTFLWWNIIVTTWLLKNIDYEEELIFIIWHEMEHVKNRDILKSLLTDIPFYLTLQYIWFDLNENILNITQKYTSKTTEKKADNWWIILVNKMNLNLECSLNFFEKENDIFNNYLQLISTHPTNINRIKNIKEQNKHLDKKCNNFIYK